MQHQTLGNKRATTWQIILFGSLVALLSCLVILFTGSAVHAQAEDSSKETSQTAQVDTAVPAEPTPSFNFVANECDTLTHFVRKSLMLFDQANDDITLSQEAILFAETNIVQHLGSPLLAVGQEVSVEASLVEMYARESQNLSDQQIQAWARFAPNVNFVLDTIQPTNDVSEATTPTLNDSETGPEITDGSPGSGDALTQIDDGSSNEDDGASGIWWLIGAAAVVGLWYTAYRREDV